MELLETDQQKCQEKQAEMACVEVYVLHAYKIHCMFRGIPWLWVESHKSRGLSETNEDDSSDMSSSFCLFWELLLNNFVFRL